MSKAIHFMETRKNSQVIYEQVCRVSKRPSGEYIQNNCWATVMVKSLMIFRLAILHSLLIFATSQN